MKSSYKFKLLKTISHHPEIITWGPTKHSQGYWVPYYFNFRGAGALVSVRRAIVSALAQKVKRYKVDIVAGADTAGISWGAWVAEKLGLPFAYVRKERKRFLNKRSVEGIFKKGAKAVLIDDTILLGATKKKLITEAARDGVIVSHILLVYSGRPDKKKHAQFLSWLRKRHVRLDACLTKEELSRGFIKASVLTHGLVRLNKLYMENPYGWHKSVEAIKLMSQLKNAKNKYESLSKK